MNAYEEYLGRLVTSGVMTDKEVTDLLKLYDRARAEIRAVGKVTRQEMVAIYNRYKLHPSEDELNTMRS